MKSVLPRPRPTLEEREKMPLRDRAVLAFDECEEAVKRFVESATPIGTGAESLYVRALAVIGALYHASAMLRRALEERELVDGPVDRGRFVDSPAIARLPKEAAPAAAGPALPPPFLRVDVTSKAGGTIRIGPTPPRTVDTPAGGLHFMCGSRPFEEAAAREFEKTVLGKTQTVSVPVGAESTARPDFARFFRLENEPATRGCRPTAPPRTRPRLGQPDEIEGCE